YPDFGYFTIAAPVDAAQVDAAREAMLATIQALIDDPVDEDLLLRARRPMIESYENALKTNNGWLALIDRAQSQPPSIARFPRAPARLADMTLTRIQDIASSSLQPGQRLEMLVLPRPEWAE